MSKQFYQKLCETTEFQRLWAEGYSTEDAYQIIKSDYACDLEEIHVDEGYEYLNTKMKKHFLAVYNLEI